LKQFEQKPIFKGESRALLKLNDRVEMNFFLP